MAEAKNLYVILSGNASAYKRTLSDAAQATDRFERKVDGLGRTLDKSRAEVDTMSGRLGIMLDLFGMLGPAAAPITATMIPALTGLAAMLGVTAAAAGTSLLAFQGVGDALSALQKASLDPTVQNLSEVKRTLDELAPAARDFTTELWELRDVGDQVQSAAAQGFFPGATEGLESLARIAGPVSELLYTLGDATGDLLAEAADGLGSDRVLEFIDFLKAEARPALEDVFTVVGNLAGSAANMWEAFDPANDRFSDWLVKITGDLEDWSAGLKESERMEDFLDYLYETGPQVADAFGSIVDMVVDLGVAAAPIGGPVLDGITAFADAVAAIAESPLGSPLIAAAAAAAVLNRTLKVTQALMRGLSGGPLSGMRAGYGDLFGTMQGKAEAARGTVRGLGTDLRTMGTIAATAGARSTREQQRFAAAALRTQATLKTVGKAAAGIGAVAVLASGAADGMGLANTATGALMGSLLGPWGAAVGGAIGLVTDFRNEQGSLADASDKATAALKSQTQSLQERASAFAQLRAAADQQGSFEDRMEGGALSQLGALVSNPLKFANSSFAGLDGSSIGDDLDRQADQAEDALQRVLNAYGRAQVEMGGENVFDGANVSLEDMEGTITSLEPAMHALGITWDQLLNADAGQIDGYVQDMIEWTNHAESAAGRTESVGKSVRELGNDALSTADSASQLAAALDALLSPTLDLEAATDQWRTSLDTLRKDLKSGAGFDGYSEAAKSNRDATRSYVEDAQTRLVALANVSTTTERDMARAVAETREEFIRSGMAAGFSKKEIEDRADALGLTPRLVRTVFEAAGVDLAERQAKNARRAYESMPKRVQTELRAEGIPQTAAQVDRLVAKYELSEKQREALLTLKDMASQGITTVQGLLSRVDNTTATPSVTVDISRVQSAISSVWNSLNFLSGRSVTTYVNTVRTSSGSGMGPQNNANGGMYVAGRRFADGGFGSDGRYYSRVPQIVPGGANIMWGEQETGWEAYISGKPGMRDRNVSILGEAARRFGYDLSPRGGERAAPGRGGGGVVIQTRLPDSLQLVVDGHRMTAYVRGHAGRVVEERLDMTGRGSGSSGRMNWS